MNDTHLTSPSQESNHAPILVLPLHPSSASHKYAPFPSFSQGRKHPPLRLEHPQAWGDRHLPSTRTPRCVRTAFSAAAHKDVFLTLGPLTRGAQQGTRRESPRSQSRRAPWNTERRVVKILWRKAARPAREPGRLLGVAARPGRAQAHMTDLLEANSWGEGLVPRLCLLEEGESGWYPTRELWEGHCGAFLFQGLRRVCEGPPCCEGQWCGPEDHGVLARVWASECGMLSLLCPLK